MISKLSEKQKKFCKEYIIDYNGTQAAIRAGYSRKGAKEQGSYVLTNPNIQEYLTSLINKQSERTEVTADKVIQEFAKIGFSNPKSLFTTDMNLKNIHDLSDAEAACITEVYTEHVPGGIGKDALLKCRYKLHSKISALESLAKHTGVYEKDNESKRNMINISIDKDADLSKIDGLVNDIEKDG